MLKNRNIIHALPVGKTPERMKAERRLTVFFDSIVDINRCGEQIGKPGILFELLSGITFILANTENGVITDMIGLPKRTPERRRNSKNPYEHRFHYGGKSNMTRAELQGQMEETAYALKRVKSLLGFFSNYFGKAEPKAEHLLLGYDLYEDLTDVISDMVSEHAKKTMSIFERLDAGEPITE